LIKVANGKVTTVVWSILSISALPTVEFNYQVVNCTRSGMQFVSPSVSFTFPNVCGCNVANVDLFGVSVVEI
jgi:hypothetical protein